jgi:hypothetical protein
MGSVETTLQPAADRAHPTDRIFLGGPFVLAAAPATGLAHSHLERPIMKHMVSYKLKAAHAAENERLVVGVFEALHKARPPGLSYATFRQSDGLSFVHIVSHDEPEGRNALTSLPAFKAFAEGVKERCEIAPIRVELTEIGSYGFFTR